MNKRNELLVVQDNWKWDEKEEQHELRHPFYAECYATGLKSIFQNALDQEERERIEERETQKRIIEDERNNIFSFIGKRGSGKTTAMDEFCRILCSMDRDYEFYGWWLERVMPEQQRALLISKRFKFHVLKPIDASLFGEDEDLFEQVMVNIYKYFEVYLEDQRSKIMEQFSNIMKSYYIMRRGNREKNSDFSIANMMSYASDTQSMQKKIAELINKLLTCRKERDFEYIVITIDDLDLNIEHGYQMVEQIQKYFAYHKIIVLISMDYDQMRIVCEQHFSQKMEKIRETNGQRIGQRYLCGLSKDTMTKIFHMSQRMYMPDFERLLKNTNIVPAQDLKCEESESLSVKHYLFCKIANHMDIYYDICGLKKHFAEPVTMREFVVYNEFLDSLEKVDFSKREILLYKSNPSKDENMSFLKRYDLNYRRFEEDIFERMVQNLLTPVQREAFRNLCLWDLERRAKYFVNSYRKDEEIVFGDIDAEVVIDSSQLNKKLIESQNRELPYSYGMLLEHIYRWGRESWNGYFEDKPYMWCILASFTVEMTRTYLHYYYNPDSNRREEKYKKRLFAFIGQSFGSRWLGEAFPRFKCREIQDVFASKIRGYADAVPHCLMINIDGEGTKENSFKEWVVRNYYIEIMGVLNMFFSSIDGDMIHHLQFKFESGLSNNSYVKQSIDDIKNTNKSKLPHITAEGDSTIKFDVMTFVLYSLNYKSVRENIINNIVKVLSQLKNVYFLDEEMEVEEIRELVVERLDGLGIYSVKESKAAFPFYNLDLSYNICKRLRKKFKNDFVKDSFMDALKVFYQEIGNLLSKQKQHYEKIGDDKKCIVGKYLEREFEYLDNFINCPLINAILNDKICKEVMDQVEKHIGKLTFKVEQNNEAESGENNSVDSQNIQGNKVQNRMQSKTAQKNVTGVENPQENKIENIQEQVPEEATDSQDSKTQSNAENKKKDGTEESVDIANSVDLLGNNSANKVDDKIEEPEE